MAAAAVDLRDIAGHHRGLFREMDRDLPGFINLFDGATFHCRVAADVKYDATLIARDSGKVIASGNLTLTEEFVNALVKASVEQWRRDRMRWRDRPPDFDRPRFDFDKGPDRPRFDFDKKAEFDKKIGFDFDKKTTDIEIERKLDKTRFDIDRKDAPRFDADKDRRRDFDKDKAFDKK